MHEHSKGAVGDACISFNSVVFLVKRLDSIELKYLAR